MKRQNADWEKILAKNSSGKKKKKQTTVQNLRSYKNQHMHVYSSFMHNYQTWKHN